MKNSRVSQFMRDRREELGMSRPTLAKLLGYAWPNMIVMIENEKASFPVDRWEKFAEVLQVPKTLFLKMVLEERYPSMIPFIRFMGEGRSE